MESRQKITIFFREIEKNFKLQLIICAVLSLMVVGLYAIFDEIINKKVNYKLSNDINLINQVESVNIDEDNIVISGFAFYLGTDSFASEISLLLRGINNGKEIWSDVVKK